MKHKREARGSSLLIALVGVAIVGSLLAVAQYVRYHTKTDSSSVQPADKFEAGTLIVSFKDGVTAEQASNLIIGYGLEPINYKVDSESSLYFAPYARFYVPNATLNSTIQKIQSFSEVTKIDSFPDSYPGDSPNTTVLMVSFQQALTKSQAKTFMSNIAIKGDLFDATRVIRTSVAAGQEDAYVAKISQNPQVQDVSRQRVFPSDYQKN